MNTRPETEELENLDNRAARPLHNTPSAVKLSRDVQADATTCKQNESDRSCTGLGQIISFIPQETLRACFIQKTQIHTTHTTHTRCVQAPLDVSPWG